MLRLAAGGTACLPPRDGTSLGFVLSGEGSAERRTLRPLTALALDPGRSLTLAAASELEMLLVGLPIFAAAGAAAAPPPTRTS